MAKEPARRRRYQRQPRPPKKAGGRYKFKNKFKGKFNGNGCPVPLRGTGRYKFKGK